MTTERPHAELSSSSISLALKCSGSVVLKRKLEQKAPSEAMLSGTLTHDLSEIALENYLQHKLTGADIPEINTDPERVERINGYVKAVFEKALEGSITGKVYAIEDKVTVHEEFQIYGYADFWAVYLDDRAKRAGIVVDLKDGNVSVEADGNLQLAFLALGLQLELSGLGKPLDYVRAAIYQSKLGEEEGYSETTFTAKQLEAFEKKVLKVAEDLYIKQKYSFKTGEHCRYCKAQEICEAYGKSLQNKTSLKLLEPSAIQFPEPKLIPDDILSNIVLHGAALEDFVAACKKYALARQLNGNPLPGIKAVEGKSRRQLDKNKETQLVQDLADIDIDAYNQKLKGIGELEKELKSRKIDKKILDSYCTRTTPPIILVAETDPRPAMKLAADYLNEIEENKDE